MFPTLHRKLIQTHFCSSSTSLLVCGTKAFCWVLMPSPSLLCPLIWTCHITKLQLWYTILPCTWHKSSHSKQAALVIWSYVHSYHKTKCISTVFGGTWTWFMWWAFSSIERERLQVLCEKGGKGKVRARLPHSISLGPNLCLKGADKWTGMTDVGGQIQNIWHRPGIYKTTKH